MGVFRKKRLAIATVVYWFLLVYIIAALVWWFIELESQNRQLTDTKLKELNGNDPGFTKKSDSIISEKKRKTTQYISEGITFLALILVGAVFVYRAVRRQIRMQQQQENFMMAITHELKTPLAVAQLNLETLQKYQLDEGKRQKLIHATLQETNRLNILASNVLVSSQLEGGRYKSAKEELDFSDLIKNCIHDFLVRYPERSWRTEIEPEVDLMGDSLLLEILVNNLLENAIKYSPKHGSITCILKRSNARVILSVLDEGLGIPEWEKNKVFQKFYRIGSEETRSAKGTGLGLYLCKKIAKDHRALIKITDNIPSGSNFTVIFEVDDYENVR